MRIVRDITGVAASFLGAFTWYLYVVGHFTSAKDSVVQATPSVLSLLCLTGFSVLVTIVFTRHWTIPLVVAMTLILPLYYALARAMLWYGSPQSPVMICITFSPLLLVVAGAFCGSRLRMGAMRP